MQHRVICTVSTPYVFNLVEEDSGKQKLDEPPAELDGTNILSITCYKRRKVDRSGKINLDSYRKMYPLSTKNIVNGSSDSTAYRCPIVEEKSDIEEAGCSTK